MALLLNTLTVERSGMLMASGTAWITLLWNAPMVERSGGFWGCARYKTEMLSIRGMRWYLATALECSSVVVDTMSWRGMVTHEEKFDGCKWTLYRNVVHRLDGPAVERAERSGGLKTSGT